MNLSEFAKPFHSSEKAASAILGITSQPKIVEFLLKISVKEECEHTLIASDDTYKFYFTGKRKPSADTWEYIYDNFDENRFASTLYQRLNATAVDRLFEAYGIEVKETEKKDKYILVFSIARQFKAIAECRGEANLIANDVYKEYMAPVEFSDYVDKSYEKHSKTKTLLYSTEARPIEEFYVCNNIRTSRNRFWTRGTAEASKNAVIENATLDKLYEKSPYVILIGMGGIGKSMMMRHLFTESIKKYSETDKFPIFVTLREFGTEKNDLFEVIASSVRRFDSSFSITYLHKFLNEGRCQLLLDGLDEIKSSDLPKFEEQLEFLLDKYPQNQVVMSTRRFSKFISYSRFKLLWMEQFSNDQSIELIKKLDFCPEEPRLKQQFMVKMNETYFKSHSSFVSNPLLLTLMLMSYRRFADIPERQALFYEEAYQTLLRRHDHDDKISYKRVFHSVVEPAEFTSVFREFCARSYRNADFEFDEKLFEKYYDSLSTKGHVSDLSLMTAENFLFDICNSVCIMYEEGQSYHFLHRSFQEYLFADYYANKADDDALQRLERWLRNHNETLFDDGIAYNMLYDMAPEKVEKSIFIPMLKYIFENVEEDMDYWSYLKKAYSNFSYSLLDKSSIKEHLGEEAEEGLSDHNDNLNEVTSVVMSLIHKILHLEQYFRIDLGTEKELEIPELVRSYIFADKIQKPGKESEDVFMMEIPKRVVDNEDFNSDRFFENRFIRNIDNSPVIFGKGYVVDYDVMISSPDKYSVFIERFKKDSCPAKHNFIAVKRYYEELMAKYSEEKPDDDF